MATYYYEGAMILTPFTIFSNEPHFDMTTISLKTQRASQGFQRWELDFSTVQTADTAAQGFLAAIENIDSTRTMIMPQIVDTNTVSTDTPAVQANASTGSSQVFIDATGITGTLTKGTFFKFSGHDKLYVATNDADLSVAGSVALNIYPALVSSVANTETLQLNDSCVLTYYTSVDNMSGITYTDGILSNAGSISLIEAL